MNSSAIPYGTREGKLGLLQSPENEVLRVLHMKWRLKLLQMKEVIHKQGELIRSSVYGSSVCVSPGTINFRPTAMPL